MSITAEHNLSRNGAPYDDEGNLTHTDPKVTAGEGRGKCSCGRLSEVLPNGASRRRWHKWHKENETSAPAEAVVTEEETTVTEEAPAAAEEEALDLIGEPNTGPIQILEDDLIGALAPKPESPARAKAKAEAEHHATLRFTKSVAKHFWAPLGVKGTKEFLGANFPSVGLSTENATRKVHLFGPDAEEVAAAKAAVHDMWEAAAKDFRDWKKTNEDYASLDHTVKGDRGKSYILTRDYFVNFGKNYEV